MTISSGKLKRWYKKVGFYLSNCGLFNAFKIYCSLNAQNKMTVLLAVTREWVTDHSGNCRLIPGPSCGVSKKTPDKDLPCQLLDEINEHILEEIVLTGLKEQNAARKCRVCSAREKCSETQYICNRCSILLHRSACYIACHTLKKY